MVVVRESDLPAGCTTTCELGVINPRRASVRPTGGERVLEGNIEARYWLGSMLQVAAFLDYGRVSGNLGAASLIDTASESLLTPGIGLRVMTDLGPIRLDIGYNTTRARTYPVFVESGNHDVRFVGNGRFDAIGWDDPSWWRQFTRRLQLHMAIGQAF
jgi:hypothetical protein